MTKGKALCLNMIVKNEMANLDRCLRAVTDHITCWVIGDTGSTDGTQEFIKSFFAERGIPGELHSFAFLNFEQARNAALDHAAASKLPYDYLLFADADMELVVENRDFRASLEAPGYRMIQRTDSGLTYWNTRLVRRNTGARYHGVTHEYIDVPGGVEELQGVWYKDHASGSNRTDKFERDIRLLSKALKDEPDNHRYWFYLAQSYRDAGQKTKAAETYAKRAQMGGWDEEAWYARLQQARCLRDLKDEGGFVREALAAFDQRPHRAEPLYDLAHFYREREMYAASVLFSELGLTIPRPQQDILFIEDFIYEAGLREEYSIAANYAHDPARKDRGHDACNWLALNREIPDSPRLLARSNLRYYIEPAVALMPTFLDRSIGFMPPDAYHPMNPSVTRFDDRIMILERTVNYTLTDDNRYLTPNEDPICTRNFLLTLDSGLNIQASREILPPVDMPEPSYKLVRGFEDMRLFAWRGQLWCISTVRELTPDGWCEQVLARIEIGDPANARLTDWRVLHPEGPQLHEKNWMPLVDDDRLQFIYLCDPTRILDEQARTIAETMPLIAADQFRGGSQAISFDGGWLALIHEARVLSGSERRTYQHRFVWMDNDRVLRGVSRAFYFHKKAIEFGAGLAWHPDGQRLMISFSVEDCESWIATVDADEVRGVLQDVKRLPSGAPHSAGAHQLFGTPQGATNLGAKTSLDSDHEMAQDEKQDDALEVTPTIMSPPSRNKISAFVVSYNRASIIETCLRSLRFADELIVVDKSSDDGTVEIARRFADKVVVAPWTPLGEDTRNYALSLCSYDWVIYLDDDECLSPDAIRFIWNESINPSADVYSLPFHDYFFGRFDSRRRDWPDYHERFFRRDALELPVRAHAPVVVKSSNRRFIPADSSIFIHHMSCASVSQWIEKTDRYTSLAERDSWFDKGGEMSANFVRQQTDYWFQKQEDLRDEYLAAYALVRVAYDIFDRVKRWEAGAGIDGEKEFAALCVKLNAEYDELERSFGVQTRARISATPHHLSADTIKQCTGSGEVRTEPSPAKSTEEKFMELAPFLRDVDSPSERRRLSHALDERLPQFLGGGSTSALPRIHCFYEVLSDTAQHHSVIAATRSMRAAGHPVQVWSYSPQKLDFLAQTGIEVRNAEDVMPRGLFERIVAGSEIRYFSDIFRYAALYEHGGLWMDTDVIMLRPFPYGGDYFLNLQWRGAHKGHFICGNVMFATPHSRHLRALYERSLDHFFQSSGKEFGDIGPKLLSDYVMSDAGAELRRWLFSPMLFNPIDWTEIEKFNQPIAELADYLSDERVFGVHLWNARTNARSRDDDASLIAMLSDPIGKLPNLTTLAERFNTDKNRHTGNRHFYSRTYDKLLSPRRFSLRRLMEIGLCRGLAEKNQTEMPSVELWQTYFPFCHVIGVDLTDFSKFNNGRFSSLVCDQSKPEQLRAVAASLEPGSLDVIVDDGSHASFDQQATLREFFSLLADGGWYFIEDLDWQPPGEDRGKITLTKDLLREIQEYGAARSIDPMEIGELSGQISQILFFDSHYEVDRAKLLGGLVAIQKRGGAGFV